MADNEITLKDIYEKLVKIETLLTLKNDLTDGAIIVGAGDANQFLDPVTGLYSLGYYKKRHQDEGKGDK
jgi:hypothetical protein